MADHIRWTGLVLAAVIAAPAWAGQTILAATPISRMDLPAWRARFEAKQIAIADQSRTGRFALVYYGDSITQNFETAGALPQADYPPVWRQFYGDRHALNLGFKGDTTASLLWRIENGEATGLTPKVAIVLIGANNLGRLHWSTAQTLAGIHADIAALRARLPATRILLVGILPSDRSAYATETGHAVNAALAQAYGQGHAGPVVFVDASSVLEHEGVTDRSLFIDPLLTPPDPPLHPTAEGARRVAEAIEPALSAMLGDRHH